MPPSGIAAAYRHVPSMPCDPFEPDMGLRSGEFARCGAWTTSFERFSRVTTLLGKSRSKPWSFIQTFVSRVLRPVHAFLRKIKLRIHPCGQTQDPRRDDRVR